MTAPPAVHVALAAVMEDVRGVAKRDRNEHQRFMFRGIDAVVNAVGPVLRKHSVIVTPTVQTVDYTNVTTSNNKHATACRVVVDYVFHGPAGDTITATVIGEAWDHGDKAAPKAMSVAFRTALLQALALPTDEADPDAHAYERGTQTDGGAADLPPSDAPSSPDTITPAQVKKIAVQMGELGLTDRAAALKYVAVVVGREVESRNDLTRVEASQVIDALEQDLREKEPPL